MAESIALDGKDVLLVFPTNHKKNSTVRILKTPKTESSVRKIFLPKSVANMLVDWKVEQDEMKEILGDEVDPELLAKVLANPEMRALLNSLAKTMK